MGVRIDPKFICIDKVPTAYPPRGVVDQKYPVGCIQVTSSSEQLITCSGTAASIGGYWRLDIVRNSRVERYRANRISPPSRRDLRWIRHAFSNQKISV